MGPMHLRFALYACLVSGFLPFFSPSNTLAQNVNPFFVPPTFSGSGQMISADVNGDGKPDLLFFDGTVLLGNGDGTFTAGSSWKPPLNLGVAQFAVADFNGDGKPDIFVAGPLNQLSVLLGKGDGTFQAAVTTSIAMPATAFVVGDLNGDGKPDVVALLGSTFFSYIGKGDGTFAAGIASGATNAPASYSLADFNGDGKLDLFVSTLGVQLGNGDGTFQPLQPFPSGALSGSSAIGDFDGDGKLDVATTEGSSSSPQVQVLFGNGDGTFRATTAQLLPTNTAILSTAAGDLSGDGKADLVASTTLSVQVLTSNGDGTFTPGKFYNAPTGGGTNIVIADFNGDKKRDVAAFRTMLLGNGDGTLQGNEANPDLVGASVTGDFNGDKHPDIATVTASGTSAFANIWLNDGKANFTHAHSYVIPFIPNGIINTSVSLLAATDVNGDGKIDLVAAVMQADLTLVVFLGNGDGSFGTPATTFVSNAASFAAAQAAFGDLNGDGKADILLNGEVFNQIDSDKFFVLLSNGDGTFGAPSSPFVGVLTNNIVVGDFNKDGKVDAILPTESGIAVLLGNGDGTFQPTTFITNAACGTNCGSVLTGDLNTDGNLDLIVNTNSGGYQVLTGNGDGTFAPLTAVAPSPAFGIGQLADFNADGHLDLWGGFTAPNLGLAFGKGDGTFSSPLLIPILGSGGGSSLIADFNGDGKPDVAIVASGQLIWLFSGAKTVTPDFSIVANSGGTATVSGGGPANYSVTLTGVGGFTGSVALTCSGLPAGATCSFSPDSVTVVGSTPVSAKLIVFTTAASQLLPIGDFTGRDSARPVLFSLGLMVVLLSGACWMSVRRSQPRRLNFAFAAMMLLALLFITGTAMSGCGGSGSNSGGNGTTGTPPGTYTITVNASAQSGASHATNLTLVVQ